MPYLTPPISPTTTLGEIISETWQVFWLADRPTDPPSQQQCLSVDLWTFVPAYSDGLAADFHSLPFYP
jgi:hypothetical protein